VTYGRRIDTEKKNHDTQLNNFYLYHNLGGNLNDSNSSNEKQDNNKNNVINDNKFIQPHSITYFGNHKDTANDKIILHNDYTNKNGVDIFKSFNNDNEKTNRKPTIVKSSFIQNFIQPSFNPDVYNKLDIIYGVAYNAESLDFFYVKLRMSQELRDLLYNTYYDSKPVIDSTWNKLNNLENDIKMVIKKCEPDKNKTINEMLNFQNPFYEFYKKYTHSYYYPYTFRIIEYTKCMNEEYKRLESKVDDIISSMKSEYDSVSYYRYSIVDDAYRKYANNSKHNINSQFNSLKKYPMLNDSETVPYIQSLVTILESEGEHYSLKAKLDLLKSQFEDMIDKSNWYLSKCKWSNTSLGRYQKDSEISHYYYEYWEKITDIARARSICIYHSNNLMSMEILYKYKKEVLNNFVKALGKLLIQKPDPNNNQIFIDDFDEFDKPIPNSNLTALETKFIEIFKQKWDSYDNKKTLGKNSDQDNTVTLILRGMEEFKGIIDTMKVYNRKSVTSKEKILSEIDQNLNKRTYKEIENGLKESYTLAKNWKELKRQIKTQLEEDYERAIQLEEEINDLFKKYLEINGETIYINTLKFELKEKIKNIYDKNEYVKKAIDLKKVVENNNAYIDELAKTSPYQVTEYVNNKDKIYSTIKLELSKIYEGDLDVLYNELSSIVKENAIDNTEDKTELENL
ncbi:reticulocyte binding protein, putative, partial [Plasmodium chabaudi adami]